MALNLMKQGSRFNLAKEAPALKVAGIGLGWDPNEEPNGPVLIESLFFSTKYFNGINLQLSGISPIHSTPLFFIFTLGVSPFVIT